DVRSAYLDPTAPGPGLVEATGDRVFGTPGQSFGNLTPAQGSDASFTIDDATFTSNDVARAAVNMEVRADSGEITFQEDATLIGVALAEVEALDADIFVGGALNVTNGLGAYGGTPDDPDPDYGQRASSGGSARILAGNSR